MAQPDDGVASGPFANDTDVDPSSRTVPILHPSIQTSAPSPGESMDVTSPTIAPMGPPARTSPEVESNGVHDHSGMIDDSNHSSAMLGPNAAVAAQAGAQQPKVVQTAFIHKLYNMLEDQSIRHLIAWSNSAESFVMSPSNDFSKVLSQYFKHTNISSFVRQLNMYGFHKVSDVFHTGSPESPMWEFKHGNGNFKRGDLVGLREIKRRASRHALVHRDSYSSVKPPYQQPGTPAEIVQPVQESAETRLTNLEHNLYDMHARLARSEESTNFLHVRNQIVMDALSRSLSLNHEMSRALLSLVPHLDTSIQRSILDMQADVQRQKEILRSFEEGSEPPFAGSRQYFSSLSLDGPPVSPRQLAQDDVRRLPLISGTPRQHAFRPSVPSNLSIAPRRYGSIGGSTTGSSPSSQRYQAAATPLAPPHPMASLNAPPTNIPRRHTSADIRAHGWQPTPSQFAPSNASTQWPPSPKRGHITNNEDQRIRDSFSSYTMQGASQSHSSNSRPGTPPLPPNGIATPGETTGSWSLPASRGDKFSVTSFSSSGFLKDSSGPPTRRGSMAHILNPAETAERDEEHQEETREDDRKRKRVQ